MNEFVKAKNHHVENFSRDKEKKCGDCYYFIFAADPQPGLVHKVEGGDGSKWNVELERTEALVKAVNKMNPAPEFLLIGGDIVDAMPGTVHRPNQIMDLRRAFSGLKPSIPILVISGNHDVGNRPSMETMLQYRQNFGDDFYSFWLGNVFYIALNSQDFFVDYATPFFQDQCVWLKEQLKIARDSRCKHVVVFMHIPPFCNNVEEEDTIHSLPRTKRIELLEQFAESNVAAVFSGHYHRNAGGLWSKRHENGSTSEIEVVVTTAVGAQLGNDDAGIRVIKITKSKLSHEFFAISEIPETVHFD